MRRRPAVLARRVLWLICLAASCADPIHAAYYCRSGAQRTVLATSALGTISSQSGAVYANSMACSFQIVVAAGSFVAVRVTRFATESGNDQLKFRDGNSTGPLLNALSGTGQAVPLFVRSSGGALNVQFNTNGDTVFAGWTLQFWQLHVEALCATLPAQYVTPDVESGVLLSQSPQLADLDQRCVITIMGLPGTFVAARFLDVRLQSNASNVILYDDATSVDPPLAYRSGSSAPAALPSPWVVSTGAGMAIGSAMPGPTRSSGWAIEFRRVAAFCSNGVVAVNATQVGVLLSQRGATYENNVVCRFEVTSPSGMQVRARSLQVDTEAGNDVVTFYHGAFAGNPVWLGDVSGTSDAPSPWFTTNGAVLAIAFASDNARAGAGFAIEFDAIAGAGTGVVAAPDYAYVGCVDNTDTVDLALAARSTVVQLTTIDSCALFCRGFTFFGVATNALATKPNCFCGAETSRIELVAESSCASRCTGDLRATCGGAIQLSTYRSTRVESDAPALIAKPLYYALGCLFDQAPAHSFADLQTIDAGAMTVDLCMATCQPFDFFGLSNGAECYCGRRGSVMSPRPDVECDLACPGDPTQTCGHDSRLSAYAFRTSPSRTFALTPIHPQAGLILPIDPFLMRSTSFTWSLVVNCFAAPSGALSGVFSRAVLPMMDVNALHLLPAVYLNSKRQLFVRVVTPTSATELTSSIAIPIGQWRFVAITVNKLTVQIWQADFVSRQLVLAGSTAIVAGSFTTRFDLVVQAAGYEVEPFNGLIAELRHNDEQTAVQLNDTLYAVDPADMPAVPLPTYAYDNLLIYSPMAPAAGTIVTFSSMLASPAYTYVATIYAQSFAGSSSGAFNIFHRYAIATTRFSAPGLWITSAGCLTVRIANDDVQTTLTSAQVVPLNRWYFVAVVVDDGNNVLTLYQSALSPRYLVHETTPIVANSLTSFCNWKMYVSEGDNRPMSTVVPDPPFKGLISDLRYFDRALSLLQVIDALEASPVPTTLQATSPSTTRRSTFATSSSTTSSSTSTTSVPPTSTTSAPSTLANTTSSTLAITTSSTLAITTSSTLAITTSSTLAITTSSTLAITTSSTLAITTSSTLANTTSSVLPPPPANATMQLPSPSSPVLTTKALTSTIPIAKATSSSTPSGSQAIGDLPAAATTFADEGISPFPLVGETTWTSRLTFVIDDQIVSLKGADRQMLMAEARVDIATAVGVDSRRFVNLVQYDSIMSWRFVLDVLPRDVAADPTNRAIVARINAQIGNATSVLRQGLVTSGISWRQLVVDVVLAEVRYCGGDLFVDGAVPCPGAPTTLSGAPDSLPTWVLLLLGLSVVMSVVAVVLVAVTALKRNRVGRNTDATTHVMLPASNISAPIAVSAPSMRYVLRSS